MKLYHITHVKNQVSIMTQGLDPSRAKNQRLAVWACTESKIQWGIVHVLAKPRNKGATIEDVVVMEIEVPDSWLTRYAKGVWYSYTSVPASRIVAVRPASEYGPSAEQE